MNSTGRSLEKNPPSTWWEHFQPSDKLASRYHPSLVKFFQRVYYHPDAPEFFYYLEGLNNPESLINDDFNENFDGRDCYVLLHPATKWKTGDEWGIIFDQITCKAVFAEDCDYVHPICNYGRGFRPLEDIYMAYLPMITENKVEVQVNGQWPLGSIGTDQLHNQPFDTIGPWRIHTYTAADVDKAVQAFQRLLHEIELRLPDSSNSPSDSSASAGSSSLPWSDPAVRLEARIIPNSFIGAFCTATSTTTHPPPFHYIAPGIRLPTETEFRAQPFRDAEYKSPLRRKLHHARPIKPTLLLLADDPSTTTDPTDPPGKTFTTVPNPDTVLNSLLDNYDKPPPPRPAGLYLTADDRSPESCENGCRLLLPFGIGRNGWARRSDGTRMGDTFLCENDPADENFDLYQCMFNGFMPFRDVPLHRVLESWAERVRGGEWSVGRDGVAEGVERFREADTEGGWWKYWVPVGW